MKYIYNKVKRGMELGAGIVGLIGAVGTVLGAMVIFFNFIGLASALNKAGLHTYDWVVFSLCGLKW